MSWAPFWLVFASVICGLMVAFMAGMTAFLVVSTPFPEPRDKQRALVYMLIMLIFLVGTLSTAFTAGRF